MKSMGAWREFLAIGVAVIHVLLLLLVLAAKEPLGPPAQTDEPCPEVVCIDLWDAAGLVVVARRPFHYHYESVITKFLMMADMPAMAAGGLASLPLRLILQENRVLLSYIDAAVWIIAGSLQWWLISRWAFARIGRNRARKAQA